MRGKERALSKKWLSGNPIDRPRENARPVDWLAGCRICQRVCKICVARSYRSYRSYRSHHGNRGNPNVSGRKRNPVIYQ